MDHANEGSTGSDSTEGVGVLVSPLSSIRRSGGRPVFPFAMFFTRAGDSSHEGAGS